MKAPLPANETQRLEALRQYGVLDTPPEQEFDDLALLASHICQTPMAMISLVDESRQWFKSKIGISASETSRDIAFCAHTILHKDEVMEIRDAEADPRFADSPLVTSDPHVRFYAGAPLVTTDGHALGVLCVMDRTPRALKPEQLAALRALSRSVVAQLELRRQPRLLANEIALSEKSRRALLSVLEDEKRSSQQLRDSEEKFRQLTDNIHEVFWMTSPNFEEVLYVSPAYEKIWGRTCASLYASPLEWIKAIHPEDRERVHKAAIERLPLDEFDVEYRVVRPDKKIRWVRDRAFPVRNAAGDIYRIVGTAEDITAHRNVEDQLRQAQKLEGIGQLAGGVAHDFNNMLAVIQMQTSLLKMRAPLDPAQTECVDEISFTVNRAAALTRQLLLFSRREVFQPRELNLSECAANTSKMLKRLIGENVQMQLKLASQPLFIHADEGMMDQVLLNLVVNARDAMPHGGQLIIETLGANFDTAPIAQSPQARAGSFSCLSVSDSGTGIPAELLPRIFEPFFTTKPVGKGTGLGLATVFGIVAQHQGWINVYSEVNHGTTFRIYIPRLARNAIASAPKSSQDDLPRGSETILLVEDDMSLRGSVRKALSQLGYHILEAPTGVKALELWNQYKYEIQLLLTDLVIPDGMSGKELAQRILQQNPRLKVIYVSGYSAEVIGKDFPLIEGVNFLNKPFETLKLAKTIRNNLDSVNQSV